MTLAALHHEKAAWQAAAGQGLAPLFDSHRTGEAVHDSCMCWLRDQLIHTSSTQTSSARQRLRPLGASFEYLIDIVMFSTVLVACLTIGLGRLLWYAYGVYHNSQLLSAMPGPPRRPGLLNLLLGNLGDLAGNQYHFTTTQWAKQYGGMTKLRLFDTYVSSHTVLSPESAETDNSWMVVVDCPSS